MKLDMKISNPFGKLFILLFAALVIVSPAMASPAAEVHEAHQEAKPKKKAKKEVKEVIFHVHLHCAACVMKVRENISFEKGVKGLEISLENQSVAIKYDPAKTSEEVLKTAIEKLGYPVHGTLQPGEKGEHHHGHNH